MRDCSSDRSRMTIIMKIILTILFIVQIILSLYLAYLTKKANKLDAEIQALKEEAEHKNLTSDNKSKKPALGLAFLFHFYHLNKALAASAI